MYPFAILLAQASDPSDPLSGGAGWVGAGLLGAVLAWLLFIHLPAKDKLITNLMDRYLAAEAAQRAEHAELEKAQRDEGLAALHSLKDDLVRVQTSLDKLGNTIDALKERRSS